MKGLLFRVFGLKKKKEYGLVCAQPIKYSPFYKNRLNALSILSFPQSFVVVVVFGDAHLSCAAALLSSRVALRVVRMARKRGRRDDDGRQPNARL